MTSLWRDLRGDPAPAPPPPAGAATNLAFAADADSGTITSDTGNDAVLPGAGATAGLMTAAQAVKLASIAAGATVNSSDAALRDRASHTGSQASATISDLAEAVQDIVAALLVQGSNITLTYNDAAGTLEIASAGGSGSTNLTYTASPENGIVVSDSGTDATLPLADATNAGLMAPAQVTKLAGVAAGATVNAADAELRDRATHTGSQASATISDLVEAVQDIVGALIGASANVVPTYDDASGTLTLALSGNLPIGAATGTSVALAANNTPISATATSDAANVTGFEFKGQRVNPANNDALWQRIYFRNSAAADAEAVRLIYRMTDVTSGATASDLLLALASGGTIANRFQFAPGALTPAAAAGADLGTAALPWDRVLARSGVGYTTGAGGTVTQATSKSTGVTLNKACGKITMSNAALAANTAVSFTFTNSTIAEGDVLVLNHESAGTAGAYLVNGQCNAGSASINVRNLTAGSLSEAIVIGFAVIKAVTA